MGVKGQKAWNKVQIDDSLLRDLYLNQGFGAEKIAAIMQVGRASVFRRLRELGITKSNSASHKGLQVKENNPNWKGGKHVCKKSGYVIVSKGEKTEREHRIIAAQKLGRELLPNEVVHHINGDRSDNRPENLEVLPSQSEHMKLHMTTEEARKRGLMPKRSKAALLAVMDL